MSYYVVEWHGHNPYLYQYRSEVRNGKRRKIFEKYLGRVHLDTHELVKHDLADPGTDVHRLHKFSHSGQAVYFFDTETTGFSNNDQVWEYTAIRGRFEGPSRVEVLGSFSERASVDVDFEPHASALSGMTREALVHHRHTLKVFRDFRHFLGKNPRMIGQNIEFDERMLNNMDQPAGYEPLRKDQSADLLDISKRLHPDAHGHKLEDQMKRARIRPNGAYHDARVDSEAVARLAEKYAASIDFLGKYTPRQVA